MQPNPASAEASARETLEDLFRALESPLLGYALRLVGQAAVAEDLVQEAFMRLHSQFGAVREPRRWLYRTVHNLALNYRRQGDRIVSFNAGVHEETGETSASADPADPLPLPDEQIARWEGIGLIRLTLEGLDARSRELLRLKFNEELSYKEIGAKCGLTVGHVGYLLHHALKAMATELAKNGIVR